MSLHHQSGEIVAAAVKASPPLAVAGMGAAGLSLADGVYILTIIYTLIQIILITPKLVAFVKDRLRGSE